MKKSMLIVIAVLGFQNVFAGILQLGGGDEVLIRPNVSTKVICEGGAPSNGADGQCAQANSNLRVQINQLQNDLYQCRLSNQKPKIWNCSYVCGGNNGMGSNSSKATACKAAKDDSGVQCSSQCDCTQE